MLLLELFVLENPGRADRPCAADAKYDGLNDRLAMLYVGNGWRLGRSSRGSRYGVTRSSQQRQRRDSRDRGGDGCGLLDLNRMRCRSSRGVE